jgi:ribulose-bisphosphate carboxylase large chain
VKPKVGLNESQHAQCAFDAWTGGCDIVKDDENLSSMVFNNFEKRLQETIKARDKAEKETGEKKIYMPNITAPFKEMIKRAEFVKQAGCEYAMVDVVTVGWSALQELKNENIGLVLHAHRAGHAAFTRNPKHGISMLTLAKLCRLIGLDQLHVGAIFGKMHGGKKEVQVIGEEISKQKIVAGENNLEQEWFDLKPTLSVCSGGLHPGKVPLLVQAMGKDIAIQMGGGIHGHPKGTVAGAKAARQAVEASAKGISLNQYAKNHSELAEAIKKWK